MADWISQYSAALDVRDEHEKAHKACIDSYTKLADRTALLEQASSTTAQTDATSPATSHTLTTPQPAKSAPSRKKSPLDTDPPPTPSDLLTRLRADLSTTQRTRLDLESRLNALQTAHTTLQINSQASASQISLLTREKRDLERRLRDREEEVARKQRLVEDVHDEMAGLNLELNMAEQKVGRLRGENEELVRRWMERMGEEADRMNLESRWH